MVLATEHDTCWSVRKSVNRKGARSDRTLGSLPGPQDILRVELPNGIVVLGRANPNSPSVVIDGYLPAGGLSEPDDKLGLADFTAQALLRGTARHSFQEIFGQLEAAGASLAFEAGTHLTSFNGRALAEDLGLLLALLAEALCQPIFPSDQVEKLRAQILAGLALRDQDTEAMASLAFDQLVYAGHPYSRPEEGFQETVRAISRADLVEFQRSHYSPRGLVICVSGGVAPERVVEIVGETFGDWSVHGRLESPDLPPVRPMQGLKRRSVNIAGKAQADLVIGAPGPTRPSPDFMAAALGNNILGQFGMMGRIGHAVREQAGLAYYAYSSLSAGIGPGPWYVAAGVAPPDVEEAIALIYQEIGDFTSQPVSQEELEDSQAHFIGSLPLSLESNAGIASALVRLERFHLGLDYYQRYADLVRSVNVKQVLLAAQSYLAVESLGVAVAGSLVGE